MIFPHHIPSWVPRVFPNHTWHKSREVKEVYLTFDDGPVPDATDYVLEVLDEYHCKATFFCVGDNVVKHPEVFQRVRQNGHSVGNHTHNHLKGWQTNLEEYLFNVERCEQVMGGTGLFRPPYGRYKNSQAEQIRRSYEVIMWDVLSGDYHPSMSTDQCLSQSLKYTQNGSIVVFHDSYKSLKLLKKVLPRYLEEILAQGYVLKPL